MNESIPGNTKKEPLPFLREEIESSDEVREVYAHRLRLSKDVPLSEVLQVKSNQEEKKYLARLAELLGIGERASPEEVIAEANLREPGWNNVKLYLSLGLGIDPKPEEVERALEEREKTHVLFLRKIGHAMQVNRAYETAIEVVPTDNEILKEIDVCVGGRPSNVTLVESDERGIVRYDVSLLEPNSQGLTLEYSYVRAVKTEKRKSLSLISEWYNDEDGIPVGGTTSLHYLSGTWVVPVERLED
jgi:hypothetical protein